MYSLPSLRSSKERGALPRRKPCTSTFCTNLRYALSEAFSSSSQVKSTSRTASLVGNFSTETFTFPPTGVHAILLIIYTPEATYCTLIVATEQNHNQTKLGSTERQSPPIL